jgi:hypothetical protein
MPQPGEIFWFKNFQFEDGSFKDKLFVSLNSSDLEKPCLALKTTSQSKWYPGCCKGCNKDRKCFFAPASWQTCFKVDTFIQLPQIIEFPTAKLIKERSSGNIEFLPSLSNDCLAQLKSCLAGYKDDIAPLHWALIYKTKT